MFKSQMKYNVNDADSTQHAAQQQTTPVETESAFTQRNHMTAPPEK